MAKESPLTGRLLMSDGNMSSGNDTSTVNAGSGMGEEDDQGGKAKWILPIILLALLGVFLWYWLNHDDGTKEAAADKKDATEMTSSADSIANALNAELSADTTMGKDTVR